jgi:hypothetical protein
VPSVVRADGRFWRTGATVTNDRAMPQRRLGVSDTFSGYRGPAIDASNPTVSLYGSDRAWIQFIVNEMSAIAMQIDPFREAYPSPQARRDRMDC